MNKQCVWRRGFFLAVIRKADRCIGWVKRTYTHTHTKKIIIGFLHAKREREMRTYTYTSTYVCKREKKEKLNSIFALNIRWGKRKKWRGSWSFFSFEIIRYCNWPSEGRELDDEKILKKRKIATHTVEEIALLSNETEWHLLRECSRPITAKQDDNYIHCYTTEKDNNNNKRRKKSICFSWSINLYMCACVYK